MITLEFNVRGREISPTVTAEGKFTVDIDGNIIKEDTFAALKSKAIAILNKNQKTFPVTVLHQGWDDGSFNLDDDICTGYHSRNKSFLLKKRTQAYRVTVFRRLSLAEKTELKNLFIAQQDSDRAYRDRVASFKLSPDDVI